MDLGLKGKVALVAAASKGLGRASALALAQEGAQVALTSRNSALLERTAQEIHHITGSPVLAIPADLHQPEAIAALVEKTTSAFGGVDILVNNAGGPPAGTFETLSDEQWQAAFHLTLLSAVRLIRAVLPSMKQQPGGRILQIVSSSAKQPIEGLLLSNAIRPGVIGLAKTLSRELAAYQITVNNVCPGRILTDRLRHLYVDTGLAQGKTEEEVLQEMAKDIPLGRVGRPDEFGTLVAFLASQQAAYITGTTIQIDGGSSRVYFREDHPACHALGCPREQKGFPLVAPLTEKDRIRVHEGFVPHTHAITQCFAQMRDGVSDPFSGKERQLWEAFRAPGTHKECWLQEFSWESCAG